MWYYAFIFVITNCIISFQCSKVLYMTDLCQESSSSHLQLNFDQEHPSITLHLTKGIYPKGFNCSVNISSDVDIAAEITTVKLRMDFQIQQCLDSLLIITKSDQVDFCHEGDLTKQDSEHASYTMEAEENMMVCFYSSDKETNLYEETYDNYDNLHEVYPYQFTIRIFAFARVKNTQYCDEEIGGFLCVGSHRCIPKTMLCDGEEDCPHGQDEAHSECSFLTINGLDESSPKDKIIPGQNFLLISVCFVIIVLISCLWYFVPKLLRCGKPPYQGNGNAENRSERLIMRHIDSAERSIATVTSSPSEFATSVTIVSVVPQQLPPVIQPVLEEDIVVGEEPPPSYESLFGTQPTKTDDNKPVS